MNEYEVLCQRAAEQAAKTARRMASAGLTPRLAMYIRRSTPDTQGQIVMLDVTETPAQGLERHCPDILNSAVPYTNYFHWIRDRAMWAPILRSN